MNDDYDEKKERNKVIDECLAVVDKFTLAAEHKELDFQRKAKKSNDPQYKMAQVQYGIMSVLCLRISDALKKLKG